MHLSNRIKNMNLSPIRKFSGDVEVTKNKGIKVLNLNIGQPTFDVPTKYFDAMSSYNLKTLHYTNSEGDCKLRQSISDFYKNYNLDYSKDNILITSGASEAILFSLLATCNPGDNILVPEPFYTNYLNFAKAANVTIKGLPTNSNDGYSLCDYELILSKIDKNTKAILLSNPSNPTGRVYTKHELDIIKNIAINNNLWVISDEVYRDFIYDNSTFTSFGEIKELEDRLILIDSTSKRFSACGSRIGFLISNNKSILSNILKLCQTRLCVPTIEQMSVLKLYESCHHLLNTYKSEYELRRDLMFDELSSIPNSLIEKPKGAFYIMLKLPDINTDDFAKWLITEFTYENETVLICPANGFYSTDGLGLDEIRMSYVLDTDDLKRACTIFKEGLKEYRKLNHLT